MLSTSDLVMSLKVVVISMLDFLLPIATWIVPILLVWRWNSVGVLLGTVTFEILTVGADLVSLFYPRSTWSHENYQVWLFAWIWGLIYCSIVLWVKKFVYWFWGLD